MVLNIDKVLLGKQEGGQETFDVEKARQEVLSEIKRQERTPGNITQTFKQPAQTKEVPKKAQAETAESPVKIIPKAMSIEEKKTKAVVLRVLGIVILLGIIVVCLIVLIGVYLVKWRSPIMDNVSRFLSLPAAYINGTPIKVYAFNDDVDALKKYLSRQQTE